MESQFYSGNNIPLCLVFRQRQFPIPGKSRAETFYAQYFGTSNARVNASFLWKTHSHISTPFVATATFEFVGGPREMLCMYPWTRSRKLLQVWVEERRNIEAIFAITEKVEFQAGGVKRNGNGEEEDPHFPPPHLLENWKPRRFISCGIPLRRRRGKFRATTAIFARKVVGGCLRAIKILRGPIFWNFSSLLQVIPTKKSNKIPFTFFVT